MAVLPGHVRPETDDGDTGKSRLSVHFPTDGSRAALPLHIQYSSSLPCRSALAVDGLIVGFFQHAHPELTANVYLPSLSQDSHALSLDVVDAHGNLLHRGPRWSVMIERTGDAGNVGSPDTSEDPTVTGRRFEAAGLWDDAGYGEDEPVEPYDPNMSKEETDRAEFVDGWWLIRTEDFEFTRPEPTDSCEDVPGWRTRSAAQGPRRVWDAFQVFNELDMLEVRLHELNETVHRFVLVEATRTHSNKPKPLHFGQNKGRFAPFLHKIIHVVVDDLPDNSDAWVLENFQRNAMLRGLAGAHPNDLVVVAGGFTGMALTLIAAQSLPAPWKTGWGVGCRV